MAYTHAWQKTANKSTFIGRVGHIPKSKKPTGAAAVHPGVQPFQRHAGGAGRLQGFQFRQFVAAQAQALAGVVLQRPFQEQGQGFFADGAVGFEGFGQQGVVAGQQALGGFGGAQYRGVAPACSIGFHSPIDSFLRLLGGR